MKIHKPFFTKLNGLVPKSLAGHFIWLLLISLVFSQLITAFILINERKEALTVLNRKGNLNRIISTVRILEESPQELHKKILSAVSSENIRYWFKTPRKNEIASNQSVDQQLLDQLKTYGIQQLIILEGTENAFRKNRYLNKNNSDEYTRRYAKHKQFEWNQIAIQLKDDRWLNVASRFHISPPLWPYGNTISISITGFLLILIAIFMIRRITKPLEQLTQAAKKLGCGEQITALNETGPQDIKTAAIAFNQMNDRLQRFITDRTNMLAAVSHDLRTPITTLRLRTELMDEGPTQDAFLNTLDEMQAITDSTLSFIREDNSTEKSQKVDLTLLITNICEELDIQGKQAEFNDTRSHTYLCRPIAIKRALRNLIENAVTYGNKAEISISCTEAQYKIIIKDEGPGIEESQLEEVFKPFIRLDKSRNQAHGGIGLGLAITRSIIRNHGGELTLSNDTICGLIAELELPEHENEPHQD